MAMRAVIDRFEGELAVLLVGEDETEFHVPRSELPAGASKGTCLRLSMEVDRQATADAEKRVSEKMDQLRQRGSRLSDRD